MRTWGGSAEEVKISPELCHSHSELVVPEMLPLISSHGSNTDQDSKHLCEEPRGVPANWFCISSKQQLYFLSPGVPWTSLVLSLPSRLCLAPELWFQALLGL